MMQDYITDRERQDKRKTAGLQSLTARAAISFGASHGASGDL
jgi:hypothetical protein